MDWQQKDNHLLIESWKKAILNFAGFISKKTWFLKKNLARETDWTFDSEDNFCWMFDSWECDRMRPSFNELSAKISLSAIAAPLAHSLARTTANAALLK